MEGRAAAPAAFRGSPITLSPNPALGADRAELVVRNAAGREVERLVIPVSTDPVLWTGIGPNGSPYLHGNYSFELVSYSNGVAVASGKVETYSRIIEARGEGGQTVLVLEGGAVVPASQVTAIRKPGGT